MDGALAGQSVFVDNQKCHSWRNGSECYFRYSEASDGVLRSYFKLRVPVVKNGH